MYPVAEILALKHLSGIQQVHYFIGLIRLVFLYDFSLCNINPCGKILYLHGSYTVHIDLFISRQLYKIFVSNNFTKEPVIGLCCRAEKAAALIYSKPPHITNE